MARAKEKEKVVTVLHTVEFDAPVKVIFDLYAIARQHAKVIGAPVVLQRRVGGRFSAWGGSVSGVNVVLESPALITQAWRTSDFPPGNFSILHLALAPAGRGRTRLTLTQHGVPQSLAREIEGNWHACYWDNIRQMLRQE